MPTTLDTHTAIKLTSLAAKARAITTELAANPAYPEQKRPSTIGKIAKGAAIAGALGAAGYGLSDHPAVLKLKRRLGASLASGRNAAARAIATTPIKPTYSVD